MTPPSSRFRPTRSSPSDDRRGQTLVEFSLLLPIFLTLVMGIIEFGFVFNALLSINYATRNASLIAAEAGNTAATDGAGNPIEIGPDCLILQTIEEDVTAPADPNQITAVRIYRADLLGKEMSGVVNVYVRGGPTTCRFPGGVTITVPYQLSGPVGYPSSNRCNFVAGCGVGQPGLDTIGVQITYQHAWRTPMPNLIGGSGSGLTLMRSNAMRMEPIL
ncbi:MAG: hypothetical protein C0498_10420 [Anaerolinea sp.]|jgi:hypothetical protein|nr:hypothetical protein [Anaerolinea sp.]